MKSRILTEFEEWRFYRLLYDFSAYSESQQNIPHIKPIVEEILVGKFGYSKIEQYSLSDMWTLKKPETG